MLFSAPSFFVFFSLYLIAYRLLPWSWHLGLIIVGSTIFYAYWSIPYVALPYGLVTVAFLGALWFSRAHQPKARRRRMILVVIALLLPLVFFKYTNFFYANLCALLGGKAESLVALPLPLGISFVTFTLIAYVVDAYHGKEPVERRWTLLSGCVLFFPHLIAGPIVRPARLIPQLARHRDWTCRWLPAFALFTVGLAKKLILADQIAPYVDRAYAGKLALGGLDYALAVYGFALQIYCDFSGYTDMALALALVLRIRLPKNFNRPYLAVSLVDFWRGWHITLSTWLRDYLYIPLGGNRGSQLKRSRNLLITMVLGGLWHGASWTFVLWGLLHGLGLVLIHSLRRVPALGSLLRMPRWVSRILTFHVVVLGWVLFRAPNMRSALGVIKGIFSHPWTFTPAHAFPLVILAIGVLTHRWDHPTLVRRTAGKLPAPILWGTFILLWAAAITLSAGHSAEFIYFDF